MCCVVSKSTSMVSENSVKFLHEWHAISAEFLADANTKEDRRSNYVYLIGLEHMRIIDTH